MTDFGIADDAVGLCKGQMLSICTDATIIDICHTTTPWDVRSGARLLRDLPHFYPAWTVVAAVVYPETGTEIGTIAVRVPTGQIYVAPNNGLLTAVLEDHGYTEAYEATSLDITPEHPEPTWYGRDLVAIQAAHLAAGFPLDKVGPPIADEKIVRFEAPQPAKSNEGKLTGILTGIDRPFGNVWTNLSSELLRELGYAYGSDLRITLDDALIFDLTLTETFGDRPLGAPVAYLNSRGYFSLGRNQGDLAERYHLTAGMTVTVEANPVSMNGKQP
ncbi:MAG: SAM-dependent chlorinase/fluorinase [Conexibacter sp.]